MTKFTHQHVSQENNTLSGQAATPSDTFDNVPGTFVYVQNADTLATRTITISAQTTPITGNESGAISLPDLTVVVPMAVGSETGKHMFSVPPAYQNLAGVVTMGYDDETDLVVGVARVDRQQL